MLSLLRNRELGINDIDNEDGFIMIHCTGVGMSTLEEDRCKYLKVIFKNKVFLLTGKVDKINIKKRFKNVKCLVKYIIFIFEEELDIILDKYEMGGYRGVSINLTYCHKNINDNNEKSNCCILKYFNIEDNYDGFSRQYFLWGYNDSSDCGYRVEDEEYNRNIEYIKDDIKMYFDIE